MAETGSIKKSLKDSEQRVEVHVEEFIPYACHFNENTIITKNGELLQVIKITGFEFETVKDSKSEKLDLRDTIRKAVKESILSNDFAIWIHTIRRKRNLSTDGKYAPGFANDLNKAWCDRHDWKHKYINELYITVLIEGQDLSISDIKAFFRNIVYPLEFRYRKKHLEIAAKKLHATVSSMLMQLEEYGAERLQIYEKNGVCFSGLSQFLSKIINLREEPVPVIPVDLSALLPSHEISFGYNVLEVKGSTGVHFAGILTVKEYHEVSTSYIDEFLQLPEEFMVVETFDFINNKKALSHFEHQQDILRLSEDEHLGQISGLFDIVASSTGSPNDFGEHQITIMLLADSIPRLNEGFDQTIAALSNLGIVVFREDILMEDAFWAQLPGNFEFITRMSFVTTRHIGGYASLYNFPAGKLHGNHWGTAVTTFYTSSQTPYLFNFHYGDNGHTFIVGPFGAGKTVLLNFLVSEARKFNNRLYFFDRNMGARIFLRSLNGKYNFLSPDSSMSTLKLNPFSLPDIPDNRTFLKKWLSYIICGNYAGGERDLSEDDRNKIHNAVEYAYSLPESQRKISNIVPKFWDKDDIPPQEQQEEEKTTSSKTTADPEIQTVTENVEEGGVKESDDNNEESLEDILSGDRALKEKEDAEHQAMLDMTSYEKLEVFFGEGEYAELFDNIEDNLSFHEGIIHGIDLTDIALEKPTIIPSIHYLLHRVEQVLDNKPTIIVLDEAWSLIGHPVFAAHLEEWLDRLRAKNTMVIFATESASDAEESPITSTLVNKTETQIFLPNNEATEAYQEIFGLSKDELKLINSMSVEKHQFLLKHNVDTVVAELSLEGMTTELAVLSATQENLAILESIILETGEEPDKWFPRFKQEILA